MSRYQGSQSPFACLTARQREVLELVAKGHTNTEIAERLGISLDGAKWHVSELLTRLSVDTRDDLAQLWHDERRLRRRAGRWRAGLVAIPSLKAAAIVAGSAGVMVAAGAVALFVAAQFPGADGERPSDRMNVSESAPAAIGPEIRVAWLDGVAREDDQWLGYYPTADGYCLLRHPEETFLCTTAAPGVAQATVEAAGAVQGRPEAPKRSTLVVTAPPGARWLDVIANRQLQMYRFEPTDAAIGRTFAYVTLPDPLADTTVIAYSDNGVELGRHDLPAGWATGGVAKPATSPSGATATPTAYGPEVFDYAARFGVSPDEAQRHIDLIAAMGDFVPRFREAAPDRFAVMSIEYTPTLRWVAWYMGEDDAGLSAVHALADIAPGEVAIRTGAPASEARRLEIAEQLRDVAQQLGLLHERDMLSLGAGNGAGTVDLWVTQRPLAEADAIAAALSEYFDAPVVVTVTDVPPWGSRPEQASATDPIARMAPADMSLGAGIGGVLTREDRCLYLLMGPERVLAVFPYAATWENGMVVVGNRRLAPGDTISGGGHVAPAGTDLSDYTWGTRPDPSCDTSHGAAFIGSI